MRKRLPIPGRMGASLADSSEAVGEGEEESV